MAIALDGTDIEHFHLSHEVQLDLEGGVFLVQGVSIFFFYQNPQ